MGESTAVSMQGRVFGLLGSMYSGFLPIGMSVALNLISAFLGNSIKSSEAA